MIVDVILLAAFAAVNIAEARIAGRPVPDEGHALLRDMKTMAVLLFIEGMTLGAALYRFAELIWRCL